MPRQLVEFPGRLGQPQPSVTRALVAAVASRMAVCLGLVQSRVDLEDLGLSPGLARRLNLWSSGAQAVVGRLVGPPVSRGSCTGLFKHPFDLIAAAALANKPTLLTLTGGRGTHGPITDHQVRPLSGFFAAATLASRIHACAADFTDGEPASLPLVARIDRVVGAIWLGRPTVAREA